MSNSSNNELKILKEVTDTTLKEALKHEVVLPSLYKDIFAEKIRHYNVEFIDDLDFATEMASSKLSSFEEKVSQNASKLEHEVAEATRAIEEKNSTALKHIQEEIGKLKSEITEIRGELYIDELTRIYNRKWLFENCTNGGRFARNGVMVFCDLDHFKQINDTYGHIVGDKVLAVFAQALTHLNGGTAVRYAGDEFILIYEGIDTAEAAHHVETLRANLGKKLFKVGEEKSFKLGFSYGIESFSEGSELISVLERADKLMYAKKKSHDLNG